MRDTVAWCLSADLKINSWAGLQSTGRSGPQPDFRERSMCEITARGVRLPHSHLLEGPHLQPGSRSALPGLPGSRIQVHRRRRVALRRRPVVQLQSHQRTVGQGRCAGGGGEAGRVGVPGGLIVPTLEQPVAPLPAVCSRYPRLSEGQLLSTAFAFTSAHARLRATLNCCCCRSYESMALEPHRIVTLLVRSRSPHVCSDHTHDFSFWL